jgi:hypothetical protein
MKNAPAMIIKIFNQLYKAVNIVTKEAPGLQNATPAPLGRGIANISPGKSSY